MSTLEMESVEEHHQEYFSPFRRAAQAVLHLARFLPETAPDAASEHFDHAEKRNDPSPRVRNYTT
jgi:hypothetical protein